MGTTSFRWRGAHEFDFHTGWKEGGVYRESMEDGPMRAALERLWALQRERATESFEALVTADKDAGGDGQWWLRHEKRYGPSRFVGVNLAVGRWEVRLKVDGKDVYVGRCDNEEDAARLADALRVVVRGEAPKNYPQPFVEFQETGGDVPAALVAAALRRDGRVDVKGAESIEAGEAQAAASSSIEEKIDEAIRADPEMRSRAEMKPSDWRLHGSKRTTGNSYIKGAKWNEEQGRTMERQGVKTLRDLALVNMDNMGLALTLTLGDDTATGRRTARRKLWNWKGAAAALVGVNDIGELSKLKRGRKLKEERTPAAQRALVAAQRMLDVASRWVTADDAFATEYAEALAAVARRQISRKDSGGDDGAEPPQKKRRTRAK